MNLTPKQRDLLLFIQRYQDANGCSPSFDDMKAALQLASKSGVHRLIGGLELRGHIERLPHRQRAITVLRRIPDPEAKPMSDDGRQAFRLLALKLAREPFEALTLAREAKQLLEQYG